MRTERIDERYLASYRLQTPCAPYYFCLQQLVIHYRNLVIPTILQVKMRFANHETKEQTFILNDRYGYQVIRIDPNEKGEIISYLVELYQDSKRLDVYSHLWVEPIHFDDNK